MFLIKRKLFANCTESKHDIQRMPEITSELFKLSQICKVDYRVIPSVTKKYQIVHVQKSGSSEDPEKAILQNRLHCDLVLLILFICYICSFVVQYRTAEQFQMES
ncbi:Hypothetical_protein [Hexamita inflata]|uniref:Hypothetical_protein n=1 Tax=Hexamita inflata TaxID=28002 RepID=A0AA86PW68_9EUKA|nr:Hypothetical protein HINF_LOCUS32423 [Hexamita inflata]